MKLLISVVPVLFFLFSCKEKPLSNCTKDKYLYGFSAAKQIDTLISPAGFFYQVNPGNKLVFYYTHTGPDCKNVYDEEYSETLIFQVPAGLNSFTIRNSDLENALCLFARSCFCPYIVHKINSGSILGTKVSDTKWDVQINVDIPGSSNKIVVNKSFVLQ